MKNQIAKLTGTAALTLALPLLIAAGGAPPEWPQFRGPNGQGVSEEAKPPVQFGPETNLVWWVSVRPGHSSPIVARGRIFLTSFDQNRLWTHCHDADTGAELWRRPSPAGEFEKVHDYGSPASSTAATDGERVYTYAGDYGVVAYDFSGREIWKRPLPKPANTYGNATSPMLISGMLVVARFGADTNSSLLALNPADGAVHWETTRQYGNMNQSSPVLRTAAGRKEIVAFGGTRLSGFDLTTGEERWFATGFPTMVIGVPALDGDRIVVGASGVLGNSNPILPSQSLK